MKSFLPILMAVVLLGQGCATPPEEIPPAVLEDVPAAAEPVPSDSLIPPAEPASMTPTEPMTFSGVLPREQTDVQVRIATTKGDIVIQLLPDEGPKAASNFVSLVAKKFYDGIVFHRFEPTFVIQGGDPEGTGGGGPGYEFEDDPVRPIGENPQIKPFAANPNFVLYARGTVAMANRGPNTNGSQFFIMLQDQPLPPAYSIFGRVVSGMEVVDALRVGDRMTSVTVE